MSGVLREFWFPSLLAALGVIPLFIANSSVGNGRRTMLTITVLFFCAAILSYIWGDPVRGPFANMVRPHDATHFTLRAGMSFIMPVSDLKDGISFSDRMISMEGRPIELWVRRTWWSGLNVNLTLNGPGEKPILIVNNNKIQYQVNGLDVNYDDYAFEVVSPTGEPEFQLIIAKDYSSIYVNARLMGQTQAIVLKDDRFNLIEPEQIKLPEYKLDRIFKYPSYVHQGERD